MKRLSSKFILLLIMAGALGIQRYYQGKALLYYGTEPQYSFHQKVYGSLNRSWNKYLTEVYDPWRSRILSNAAGSLFAKACGYDTLKHDFKAVGNHKTISPKHVEEMAGFVSFYNTVWFVACLLFGLIFIKRKMLFMLGYFVFTSFTLSPMLKTGIPSIFPWDGPQLFFWTIGVYAALTQKFRILLPAIVAVATGFKEDIVLLSICPLFWTDISWKNRIKKSAIVFMMWTMVKVICDISVDNSLLFTAQHMTRDFPGSLTMVPLMGENLKSLFSLRIDHVVFSAAFLFAMIFFTKQPWMTRSLALAYIPFLLVCCVVTEIRLYHMLIPLFFVPECERKVK